jgi:hypothetical protein
MKNTETRKIQPTHPGEMLREDFMPDYGLTTKSDLSASKRNLSATIFIDLQDFPKSLHTTIEPLSQNSSEAL